jgi:hypothetical protein
MNFFYDTAQVFVERKGGWRGSQEKTERKSCGEGKGRTSHNMKWDREGIGMDGDIETPVEAAGGHNSEKPMSKLKKFNAP